MGYTGANTERYDVIVVGIGGMGSAATYHLSKQGMDVLGIEKHDIPHSMGSSHGSTRIIRKVQHEEPDYVPLVERAYELWEDLEVETGRDLLHITGSVHSGDPETGIVSDAREACERNDITYEELSAVEINERFPGFDLPDEFGAIYQSDGGFLDCERCVSAHVEAAHATGATVHGREQVIDWSETTEGVVVKTDKGRYEADELVVTAGSWTTELLPSLTQELVPVRAMMTWLQPKSPELFTPDEFPVFVISDEDEGGYGFPMHDVPGFKFGRSSELKEAIDPKRMDREPTRAEEELHRRFAEKYFPEGAGPTLSLRTCLQTYSNDEHFIVGRVPEHDSVTVGAGFSGHGFKFSSAIGEALADLAVSGTTPRDIAGHGIDRLSG
jgi:sarcosine oxidase